MMKCFLFTFAYCCVLILKGQNLIPYQSIEFDNKFGYIDEKTKKLKIFYHFEKAYPFNNNFALVQYGEKVGAIDTSGNIIIPFMFNYIHIIDNENAKVLYRKDDTSVIKIFKNYIIYKDSNIVKFNKFIYFDKNNSNLKEIITFNSDSELEALEKIKNDRMYTKINNTLGFKTENKKKIWNTFQIGVIDNAKRQGFYELKGATYLQNKNFLSGISYGFQRTKLFSNNGTYFNYQIPVYLSQILFFKQPQKGSSPFVKMDVGYVLSEYSFTVNNGNKLKYNGNVFQTNLLLNCGFGIKLSPPNKPTGAILELGYKFLPQRMHLVENTNYVNLLLGMIF